MKKLLLSLSLIAVVSAPAFGASTTLVPAPKDAAKTEKSYWQASKDLVYNDRSNLMVAAEVAALTAVVGGVSYAAYRYFKAPAKRAAVNAELLTSSVAAKALSTRANEALNFIATHKKLVALALAGVAVVGFEALDGSLLTHDKVEAKDAVKDKDGKVTSAAVVAKDERKRFELQINAYGKVKEYTPECVANFAKGMRSPFSADSKWKDAGFVAADLTAIVTAVVLLDAMTTYLVDLKGQMYTVALINKIFAKSTKDAQVVAAQPAIA